ncbi:MAG: glycosyl transferase family 1 [Candidatus Pelagibacter sp.]|nr:glycosyl transferase family 1 [Candidatus Pelagibacter sp.]|tara:strand:- start:1708 stop:2862 length:1155 start_codon:yes stop_codon:yes gene_type:complete
MSSKKKVLQVIPRLGHGGAETGCFDLAHYLYENNYKSYIATSGGPLLKYINKKKVKVFRLPVQSKNPLVIFLNTIILVFIIIICNIDIIHARSRAPAWSCLLATKFTRRKFVTTFHGTYNFNNSLKKWYNSVMVRSDLVIAGTNFIFSHIKNNYSKYLKSDKRFLVIFRGINIDYFNPKKIKESDKILLKKKWNISENKKIILLPGRLTNWKGQEMFIEAINKLKNISIEKNFLAIILGSDQGRKIYKKKLIRLVEQHRLNNEIMFVEHLDLMPIAYEISDIIVSASIEPEAFGRVSVEAQAMEKPIVASNIGGSNETIINDKTGFLFEAGNSKNLSEKLNEVLNLSDVTRNGIGAEGRKNVISKFNVEKMCHSTYSEYNRLIK